jgi:hypothetical protein
MIMRGQESPPAGKCDVELAKDTEIASAQTQLERILRDVVGNLDRIAGAGVRLLEVGEGATRVRLELDPVGSLLRESGRGSVSTLAPGPDSDHERADDHPTAPAPATDEAAGADEQAGDDLDTAHL